MLVHADLIEHLLVFDPVDMASALVGAHRQQTLKRPLDRCHIASRQQIGQVLHRDAQLLDIGDQAVHTQMPGIGSRTDRRQRRHIPDHRQGAVLGMQRQGHFPFDRHLVDRALAGRDQPGLGDAVLARLGNHFGVIRVEEDVELGLVEVLVIDHRCGFLDAVGVIKKHAEIADPADTGFRTNGRLTSFDAGVAEDAFFGLARLPVVIDFLVRAARHAHAPAAAFVLVDQDNAVFFTLVDRARRATRHAGRVQAMLAKPGQIHHEGVFELAVNLLLDVVEVLVLAALGKLAAKNFFPVRAPFDLLHPLAGDQAARARGRRRFRLRRRLQMVVIEGERLVVIVDFRQIRVREYAHQQLPFAALARLDLAALAAHPAAVPAFLVLPFLRVADAGFGLDIVEPGIFNARPVGPDVLASHRAGVATNALVQVQHHADLCAYFHVLSL